ncbi:MAG: RNA polymerase sigma factor [Ruminococcaceae bacterium]|nr:RNA polymerase sigma factor [Oscillospiraceae bacterium]
MKEFEKLYEAYFSDVFKYLRSLARDEDLAEEITAETFFRAMRSLSSFRGECDVKVWLLRIAKNTYFTHLSKNKRLAELDLSYENTDDGSISADEELIERETAGEILRSLHELGEPYKEVFMLRVYAELSFSQIGDVFSKNENWACVTYHRARKKIIEKISEKES